jgi:hypothetical protein
MTEKETREILTWLGKKTSAIAIPIQKIMGLVEGTTGKPCF